ncbi:Glu/Leu/Phe/Val dehydrogenase dimerization domain-containing protein [Streptomyces mirabilis]|uniref:Glu/Leu/Phe/Val dehydrogenase dimerization domain-containing protein n=1 Tax=Streptomyces mirabilis TaxID=68239 RepID=UPI003F4AFA15
MPAFRAGGGLRMREGCRHEEVREPAVAMSVKEALHYDPSNRYLPMGGAKGGTDCDPLSSEARGWTAASPRSCAHGGREVLAAIVFVAMSGCMEPTLAANSSATAHSSNEMVCNSH